VSMENELPGGWVRTTLEQVTAPVRITVLPKEYPLLPYVGMEQVEAETMKLLGTVPANELKSNAARFWPGDVLYGRLRPYLNKVLRPDFEGLCSPEFLVFPQSININSRYLQYFLNSWSFRDFATHLNEGDRPRVDWDQLKIYKFPLAPLPEQRRIVAAIEQQFSRLDAAATSLRHARAKLKRQRAAILKAAVEGTLTIDWRAQYPASETAEQLLQRILHERRAKWEGEQLGKKKAYKEPEPLDMENLPELPEGWMWTRAEQLCEFITKGTTPASEKLFRGTGEKPFIKVYNLTDRGLLDFTVNPTFVSEQTHSRELARSKVFPGDVLMNIVGPPLGKVSIVPNLYPEWNINQAIAFFRPLPDYNRKLLCYSLLTEEILSWAKSRAKATAGQFNLTLEICRDLPLPLPPLTEQQQIVSEVEARLSIIAQTELEVEANLKRAERLRQTILAEAFAGRLVPQYPDDEPASVLLERIRQERKERDGVQKKGKAGNGRARAAVKVPGAPVKIDMKGMEQVALWESACF